MRSRRTACLPQRRGEEPHALTGGEVFPAAVSASPVTPAVVKDADALAQIASVSLRT